MLARRYVRFRERAVKVQKSELIPKQISNDILLVKTGTMPVLRGTCSREPVADGSVRAEDGAMRLRWKRQGCFST
jgi:hypothetical protein